MSELGLTELKAKCQAGCALSEVLGMNLILDFPRFLEAVCILCFMAVTHSNLSFC